MRRMTWSRVPLQNLNICILSRPPTVVFALCLAAFCVATFSLGVYVKHSPSPIRNPDELSWNVVGEKLSKLDFCLQHPDENEAALANHTGLNPVYVPFEFSTTLSEVWKNLTYVFGSLSNTDLGLDHSTPVNLSFSMSLIESQKQICLTFYHPPSLKFPSSPGCNPLLHTLVPKISGAFVIPKRDKLTSPKAPLCPDKSKFNVLLNENPDWVVNLSESDRSVISMHLLATSFFLLITFLTVVCFAVCRINSNRGKTLKMTSHAVHDDDKEPLNP